MATRRQVAAPEVEPLDLFKAMEQLLEECRMVLPGIQALFGFQLIAVLSNGFPRLSAGLKDVHLVATVLTAIAIVLVMSPAAYHRQASPRAVTARILKVSTRLLVASMVPLAMSLCLELYLVGFVITESVWVAAIVVGFLVVHPGVLVRPAESRAPSASSVGGLKRAPTLPGRGARSLPSGSEGGGARRGSESERGIRRSVEPASGEPLAGAPKAQIPSERKRRMERETGVEPATSTLARWRSTTELFPQGTRRISEGRGGGQACGARSTIVPPQCAQTRVVVLPNFFSGAHSSQSGRSVCWHR